MKGLIKKDFMLTKSLAKSFIVFIVIFAIMSMTSNSNTITSILPVVAVMLTISTLSYDSYYKWDAFALTLPISRKDIVRSKYMLSLIYMIILALITAIISVFIYQYKGIPLDMNTIGSTILGSLFGGTLVLSLSLPFMYKFGSENGRIVMFIVVLIVAGSFLGVAELFKDIVDQNTIYNAVEFLSAYFLPIMITTIILLLAISYICSIKIYSKKEF